MARSVGVPSSVSRIFSYMEYFTRLCGFSFATTLESSSRDHLPGTSDGVGQAINVHERDQDSTGPTRHQKEPTILPVAHTTARTGELKEWKHGKGKLQRQHDL